MRTKNPFRDLALLCLPFSSDLIDVIYAYVPNPIWIFTRSLNHEDEISQVSYDCFKRRTCIQTRQQASHPLHGLYSIVDFSNKSQSGFRRRINRNSADAFYDETCLSRTCGLEEESSESLLKQFWNKAVPEYIRIRIDNPSEDGPDVLRFSAEFAHICPLVSGGEFRFAMVWELDQLAPRKKDGAFLCTFLESRKLYYISFVKKYAQILLELQDENLNWSWALYNDDVIVNLYKEGETWNLLFYHLVDIQDPADSKHYCLRDEDVIELPAIPNNDQWRILCDSNHQLLHLVSKTYLLQFHIKSAAIVYTERIPG